MAKYIIFIFFCSVLTTFGQVNTIKVKKQKFTSATFPGGNDSLIKFIDKNFKEIVSSDLSLQRRIHKPTEVEALVYLKSDGKIEKVQLVKSSFDSKIDTLFIKSIKTMPTWVPATNELGNNCKDKQTVKCNLPKSDNIGFLTADPVDTTGMYKVYNKKK